MDNSTNLTATPAEPLPETGDLTAEAERKLDRLLKDAQRHPRQWNFFELVRCINQLQPHLPRTGQAGSLRNESLRFGQAASLRPNLPHLDTVTLNPRPETLAQLRLFFFGLCGLDGPLPLEITSDVYQRTNNYYDAALMCFLDIINHRFISLLYRAETFNSCAVHYDRNDEDLHRVIMRALSGAPDLPQFAVPHLAPEAYAGQTVNRCGSAGHLRFMLRKYFGTDVELVDHAFGAYRIPADYACILGSRRSCRLGFSAQIGTHYYSHTQKFIIIFGPLDFDRCISFFPGRDNFRRLIQIVNFCLTTPQHYDVVFKVRRSTLPPPRLNGQNTLGRSTFLPSTVTDGLCSLTLNVSRLSRGTRHTAQTAAQPGT